jgi:hypothetical protein
MLAYGEKMFDVFIKKLLRKLMIFKLSGRNIEQKNIIVAYVVLLDYVVNQVSQPLSQCDVGAI